MRVIAPHPDDEIIGCFTVLKNVESVFFLDGEERKEEAVSSSEAFNFKFLFIKFEEINSFLKGKIFAPDPFTETHPLHKIVGMEVFKEWMNKQNFELYFYTTNMNTFYTRELNQSRKDEKEKLLKQIYVSQRDLWRDKKYFLFEGRIKMVKV
jgi:hypothetical protein